MRIRTIDQAYKELLQNDPGCALGKTGLRRLVISGEIPSRKAGCKYLLDLDALEAYMRGELQPAPTPAPGYGEIRPVR